MAELEATVRSAQTLQQWICQEISSRTHREELGEGLAAWAHMDDPIFDGTLASYQIEFEEALAPSGVPETEGA